MWYFWLSGVFAFWTLFDSFKRRVKPIFWGLGVFVFFPIAFAYYLAKRPLKVGETREGGLGWNFCKNFAGTWTIFMASAWILGFMETIVGYGSTQGRAERTGATLGLMLGTGLLGAFWFFPVVGVVMLGLALKKSSIIERGTLSQLRQPSFPRIDRRAIAITALLLFNLFLFSYIGRNTGSPVVSHSAAIGHIAKLEAKYAERKFGDALSRLKNELEARSDIGILVKAANIGGGAYTVSVNEDGKASFQNDALNIKVRQDWKQVSYSSRLEGLKKICTLWGQILGKSEGQNIAVDLVEESDIQSPTLVGSCKGSNSVWVEN